MDRWLYAWGIGYAAVGASSVLLPLYALELGAGAFIVGAIASMAAFAAIPGVLLWGYLVGKLAHPRLFLLGALSVSAGVLAAAPLVENAATLILVNAALWFVVAAAAPVILLFTVEGAPQTEWDDCIGHLNEVQGYGWISGITFSTVWSVAMTDSFSVVVVEELLFRFLAVTTLLSAVVLMMCFPTQPTTSLEEFLEIFREMEQTDWGAGRFVRAVPYGPTRLFWTISAYVSIRREGRHPVDSFDSALRRYLFATILFFAGFAIFWGPLPAYVLDIDHTMQVVFGLVLLTNFGSVIGYGPIGEFFRREGLRQFQTIALIARAILIPGIAFVVLLLPAWNLPILAWLFVIIGITWAVVGVTVPGIVANLAPDQYESDALGIYTVLAGLATGIGAIAGGWIAESLSYTDAFVLAGGTIAIGVVLIPRE